MLTAEQLIQFDRLGYIVLPNIFPDLPKIVDHFRSLIKRGETLQPGESSHWNSGGWVLSTDKNGQPIPGRLHKIQGLVVEDPTSLQLMKNPTLVSAVQELLGTKEVDVFGTKFFPLYPGGVTVNWHQDSFYFGTTASERIVSVGLYMEDTDVENGCLKVVPGSHLTPTLEHHADPLKNHQGLTIDVDNTKAVNVSVPAGTAVLFNANLQHGANPNITTDRTRFSSFWHYVQGDLKFTWSGIDFSRGVYKDRHRISSNVEDAKL